MLRYTYEQLIAHWITGESTQNLEKELPESWRAVLNALETDQKDLASLALTTQFQTYCTAKQATTGLHCPPPLPELSLPTLPEAHRALFRRTMELAKKHGRSAVERLLNLLVERHFSAHPADWMPTTDNTAFPELYWPWFYWLQDVNQQQIDAGVKEALTEETWSEFFPAQHIQILKSLRHSDAPLTRELIEKCALSETAEKRFNLMQVLKINLSVDDVPLLELLAKDRSKKVALLARQLLSQLNVIEPNPSQDPEETSQQLTEWFELHKRGLIKRKLALTPKKLKSKKQQSMRTELLGNIALRQLAQAFALTLDELILAWQFANHRLTDNMAFLSNAASTLPNESLSILLNNIQEQLNDDPDVLKLIALLLPRLSEEQRTALLDSLLQNPHLEMSFTDCLNYIDKPLKTLEFARLQGFSAWRVLLYSIDDMALNGAYVESSVFFHEVLNLSFLIPPKIALAASEAIVARGVFLASFFSLRFQ